MDLSRINRKQWMVIAGSLILLLIWIFVPLLAQQHGYSAIEVSFGITAVYYVLYLVFKKTGVF